MYKMNNLSSHKNDDVDINREKKDNIKKEGSKLNSNKMKQNLFEKVMANFFKFFNANLKRKTIVVFIISLILFGILFSAYLSQMNGSTNITGQADAIAKGSNLYRSDILKNIVNQKLPVTFLCIFSGIVPFFYIPALCTYAVSSMLASDIITYIQDSSKVINMVSMSISSVLQLFGFSIAIAAGIYYCSNYTKRFRYSEGKHTTFNDLKYKFYELKNDQKNKEKVIKANQKAEQKRQKLNVKIDYLNLFVSFIVSIFIIILASLIALI